MTHTFTVLNLSIPCGDQSYRGKRIVVLPCEIAQRAYQRPVFSQAAVAVNMGSSRLIFEEWYGSYVICPRSFMESWIARTQASNIEPVTSKLVKRLPRCRVL